ncbi:hypothetical protein [Salana multivorans]
MDRGVVVEILKGAIEIEAGQGDEPLAQTGAQIASVLDVVYAAAAEESLGIVWDGATPTLRVWAPTATDVALQVWTGGETDENGSYAGDPDTIDATLDEATGIWTVEGDADWADAQYLWQVDVYAPSVGDVVTNVVTDPYSVGLTTSSTRSVVVDLTDARWAPAGWSDTSVTPLRNDSEQTIYELHIRDFSAWDESVPEDLRGTYQAFTLPDSDGVNHLRDLSEAGLTTVHLLPSFDIATTTINEDRSQQKLPEHRRHHPDPGQRRAPRGTAGLGAELGDPAGRGLQGHQRRRVQLGLRPVPLDDAGGLLRHRGQPGRR